VTTRMPFTTLIRRIKHFSIASDIPATVWSHALKFCELYCRR
jgi:hypothetical protein